MIYDIHLINMVIVFTIKAGFCSMCMGGIIDSQCGFVSGGYLQCLATGNPSDLVLIFN